MKINELVAPTPSTINSHPSTDTQPNKAGRGRRSEIRDQIGSNRNRRSAAKAGPPSAPASPLTSDLGPLTSPPTSCPPSDLCPQTADLYSLRRHTTFWSLTFKGQTATFDHEQGAYYVAYLLLNPPDEPIHGVALELKALTFFRQFLDKRCETLITDPLTGEAKALACDAPIVELNLCVEEAEGLAPLRRKIEELEAILENDHASEPVKAEVRRELEEIYAYQKRNPLAPLSESQKAVRAVRRAITRFTENLATAVDPQGNPHPVLRSFAEHIHHHLIIPSLRFCKAGRRRAADMGASTFTYEPPPGVKWTT